MTLANVSRMTIVAFYLAALHPALLHAERIELTMSAKNVISNAQGRSRVLIAATSIPNEVRGELITSAILTLPVSGALPSDELFIRIDRVTTGWVGRQPTWESPWRTPGGDIDRGIPGVDVLWTDRARASLSFDVTQIVRDIADGRAEDCGFLLSVPEQRGAGFRSEELEVLGTFEGAVLSVSYSPIKRLGFYGSQSLAERAQQLRTKREAEARSLRE